MKKQYSTKEYATVIVLYSTLFSTKLYLVAITVEEPLSMLIISIASSMEKNNSFVLLYIHRAGIILSLLFLTKLG